MQSHRAITTLHSKKNSTVQKFKPSVKLHLYRGTRPGNYRYPPANRLAGAGGKKISPANIFRPPLERVRVPVDSEAGGVRVQRHDVTGMTHRPWQRRVGPARGQPVSSWAVFSLYTRPLVYGLAALAVPCMRSSPILSSLGFKAPGQTCPRIPWYASFKPREYVLENSPEPIARACMTLS